MKKIKLLEKINIVLLIIAIILSAIYLIFTFFTKKETVTKVTSVTDKFNYMSYEKDTEIYKKEFENLKLILKETDIDYEVYANSISKLFIIDFYTLSNKKSNQDVGGTQYMEKTFKDNFVLKASDTIYKYIKQLEDLPTVKEVLVKKIEKTDYEYNKKIYEAYAVHLNWEYEKDLGYEKEGTLILIKDNEQLFIVEKR